MIINPIPVWVYILAPTLIYLLKLIGWFYRKVKGKRLAVLGMKGAGKTRFYRFLQKRPYIEEETAIDDYEEFEYKTNDGKTIIIEKGKDIGGSEDYVRPLYENIIKDCDILVFCFDLKRYLSDSTYEKQVNVRFEFVCRKFKELKRSKGNFVKIASHIDEIKDPKNAIKQFHSLLKKKSYYKEFIYNFFPVDTTNSKNLEQIVNKIF